MNERAAAVVVWSIWSGALAWLVWWWARIASPIPLAEDWFAVPLLAGHRSDLLAWMWEQNNEHRMPVARVLLLGVLRVAGGDFRAGGLLNLGLLAVMSGGLILFVRHLRGGRTDIADSFFPLTFLHFGHSIDVLFPFQITFVLTFAFILGVGSTLFLPGSLTSARAAIAGGIGLLLLPLSGFIGLAFVLPLAGYIFFLGWRCRSGMHPPSCGGRVGAWLMGAAIAAVVLGVLYFVGFKDPSWKPPNPGVVPSIKVTLKFFALGFGPAAQYWWTPAVAAATLFLALSCWQAVRRVQRSTDNRIPVIGAAIFLVTSIGFVAAVGWGRAGSPEPGIPLRYIWIAIPAFVASYLTWVVSGSRFTRVVLRGLALTMLVVLPVNTVAGHRLFADWYHARMTAVASDIRDGVPIDELAVRHQPFLVHWWSASRMERHMRMLRDAGIPPFDRAVVREP